MKTIFHFLQMSEIKVTNKSDKLLSKNMKIVLFFYEERHIKFQMVKNKWCSHCINKIFQLYELIP